MRPNLNVLEGWGVFNVLDLNNVMVKSWTPHQLTLGDVTLERRKNLA